MKCQNCGAEVPMGADVCPYCDNVVSGNNVNTQSQNAANIDNADLGVKSAGQSAAAVQPVVEYRKGFEYLALIPIILLIVVVIRAFDGGLGKDVSSQLQGSENDEKISIVKGGSPTLIPDITFGDAYENFFGNPAWRYFVADDESEVVEFTGECSYGGESAEAYIQFVFEDEEGAAFELYYARMRVGEKSIEADQSTIIELVYRPFSDYAENILEKPLSDEIEQQFLEEYQSAAYQDYIGQDDSSYTDASDNYEEDGEEESYEEDAYQNEEEQPEEEYEPEESYDNSEEEWEDESYDDSEEEEEAVEEYIFEDSSSRYLKASEIEGLDLQTIRLAKNEIYARHGRKFKDKELQDYFDEMPWYEGTIEPEDFDEKVFNQYEKKNIKKLASYDK